MKCKYVLQLHFSPQNHDLTWLHEYRTCSNGQSDIQQYAEVAVRAGLTDYCTVRLE